MTKYYRNPSPPENYAKPKPPPCPTAPTGKEFVFNVSVVADSKDVIKEIEGIKMKNVIKQLLKFYGLETEYFMQDGYIYNLEQLVNIQAQQIERFQERFREVEPQKPMNEHHKTRIA